MKFQTVVYREHMPWRTQDDLNCNLFNNSDADVILFPGWSFQDTYHVQNFQDAIKNIKTLAFLELKRLDSRNLTNALFSISKGEMKFVSFQLFATSNEITSNPILGEIFVEQFSTTRAFKVKNKELRVIQCGEINILKNEQAMANRVGFRFTDSRLQAKFSDSLKNTSLILNPQHTPMGNQGKMSRRREYLSSNKRGYISTSNVALKTKIESSKSAHYVYYNGNELLTNLVDRGQFHCVYEYNFVF